MDLSPVGQFCLTRPDLGSCCTVKYLASQLLRYESAVGLLLCYLHIKDTLCCGTLLACSVDLHLELPSHGFAVV